MASYNLLTESWIPILRLDGQHEQIGLRTALQEAHLIREVYADTPLETAALNRLLLALYLRVFPEQNDQEKWWDQWDKGTFSPKILGTYFDTWQHRFDLLDANRPFYQTPSPLQSDKGTDFVNPIEKLFMEEASNNNPVFYVHTSEAQERCIPLDKAARGLVTFQAYTIGGGVAKPFNFANAPMVGTAIFWLRRQNLLQSLLMNAPPVQNCRKIVSIREVDLPTWEQPLITNWEKRIHHGYLDYLTWQSRAVKLVVKEKDGEYFATAAILHQGNKIEPNVFDDPLVSYKLNKDGERYSLSFNPDKALWRDSTTFLGIWQNKQGFAPAVLKGLPNDEEFNCIEADVLGMSNDQGTINFLRQERLPIYAALRREDALPLYNLLQDLLNYADEQRENLRFATKVMCHYLLGAPKDDGNMPDADSGSVSKLIDHFSTVPRYWAALETPFYEALQNLAKLDVNNDLFAEDSTALKLEWAEKLFQIAKFTFQQATQIEISDRVWQAITEGEKRLKRIAYLRNHRKQKSELLMT
jgi:CRISPR system Cascade subunit CasA